MPESAFSDHIGIGDNEIPCKVVSFDLARDDAPPVVAQRDPEGTMRIVEWEASPAPGPTVEVEQARFTAERAGWFSFPGLRPSSHYLVDTSAAPNSCSRCGELERSHGEDHEYVAPDDVLRLARMKARRQERLNPPRRMRLTPDMLVTFTVDFSGLTAALEGAIEAIRPPREAFEYDYADTVYEADAERYLVHASATGRRSSVRLSPDADPASIDWGEPLEESDANWPVQGRVCAHVCGGNADHECDARATEQLTYALPSGGTRTMPICAACNAAEMAAKEHVDA